MSSRTDVDRLSELPGEEFTERVRAAVERMELRSNRALAENRDLTEREKQLSSDDHDELEALRKAEAVREHRERVIAAKRGEVMGKERKRGGEGGAREGEGGGGEGRGRGG